MVPSLFQVRFQCNDIFFFPFSPPSCAFCHRWGYLNDLTLIWAFVEFFHSCYVDISSLLWPVFHPFILTALLSLVWNGRDKKLNLHRQVGKGLLPAGLVCVGGGRVRHHWVLFSLLAFLHTTPRGFTNFQHHTLSARRQDQRLHFL